MSTEFSILLKSFPLSESSPDEVVGWIVTLGLLSTDVMVVSGAMDVILTDDDNDKTGGIDIGRETETDEGVSVDVDETLDERADERVESVVEVVAGGEGAGVEGEDDDIVKEVVVQVVEVVETMTEGGEVVDSVVTTLEDSLVVVVVEEVIAEIETEGMGGVDTAGGGKDGDPIDAVREGGRAVDKPGGSVGGKDCVIEEGDGEEEFKVGDVEVSDSGSPVRMEDTCRGGEVVTGVPAMEVVGGRGRLDGLIPAARHCSSKDATVFFFGLETPRPRCLDLSWASSILFFFSSLFPSAARSCRCSASCIEANTSLGSPCWPYKLCNTSRLGVKPEPRLPVRPGG